jgi:hypothetical protein
LFITIKKRKKEERKKTLEGRRIRAAPRLDETINKAESKVKVTE